MNKFSENQLPKIAILAPGLLGASLAAASKHKQICESVSIWARREETRKECETMDWCDNCYEYIEDAVKDADIVWICSPVSTVPKLASKISPYLKENAIVSDVGSTKARLVDQCEVALQQRGVFIGSHPMAGSEKSGLAHCDKHLFEGRPCFVTPKEDTDLEATKIIEHYWRALGMNVYRKTPQEHDQVVAYISHLPHLTAAVLASLVAEKDPGEWLSFVGTGFKDTTRIAAGSVPMWMDIVTHNRVEVLDALKNMAAGIEFMRSHLEHGQFDALKTVLEDGKSYRSKVEFES